MRIISWDVGIVHLAYCILEYSYNDEKNDSHIEILDWDQIDLIDDNEIKLSCCCTLKTKKKCKKKAKYILNYKENHNPLGFCNTHYDHHKLYWSQEMTENLFKKINTDQTCNYYNKNEVMCSKKSTYTFNHNNTCTYLCTPHYKNMLKKKIKEFTPQYIKKKTTNDYTTSQLQIILVKKLDELAEHFSKLKIEEVVIENQPSIKNPRMKSIANMIFDYYIIRGYIDKYEGLNIKMVKFINPNNKLKINNDNTIEVFKNNKNEKKKYKLTKALSIKYTEQLLDNEQNIKLLDYLDLHKKKDDMCDAYLQGRYYLEKNMQKKKTNKL